MLNKIKFLINDVIAIENKYSVIRQKTGENFNIFLIAGIEHDEVKICKIISELINPNGCHGQGDIYLKLFINHVLPYHTFTEGELKNTKVYTEFVTNENRRIDLAIITPNKFIAIEVKIYAVDQYKQCYDYYLAAKRSRKYPIVYYLTIDGHEPSKDSKDKLNTGKELFLVSFSENIINWLKACLSHHQTIKISPIREVIQQLLYSMRRLTNKMQDDTFKEIIGTIGESAESYKAAKAIAENIEIAKYRMMYKLFQSFDEMCSDTFCKKYRIKRGNKDSLVSTKDNYEICLENWFGFNGKHRKNCCPGIGFWCLDHNDEIIKLKDGIELWFRIEVDECLYACFCFYDTYEKYYIDLTEEMQNEVKNRFFKPDCLYNYENGTGAIAWEYLNNREFGKIDFKNMNDSACRLFDINSYEASIEYFKVQVEEMLKKLL